MTLAEGVPEFGVLIEAGEVFFGGAPNPCLFLRLRLSSIKLEQLEPSMKPIDEASAAIAMESRMLGLTSTVPRWHEAVPGEAKVWHVACCSGLAGRDPLVFGFT